MVDTIYVPPIITPINKEAISLAIGVHDRVEHAIQLAADLPPSPKATELLQHLLLTQRQACHLASLQ